MSFDGTTRRPQGCLRPRGRSVLAEIGTILRFDAALAGFLTIGSTVLGGLA